MDRKSTLLAFFIAILPFAASSQILIITADEYAEAMAPFVEWKGQKGMWCEVTKMSEIGSSANDLKAYIATYHINKNNRYLLLVGDADRVPTHISYGVTNPNEYSAYSDAEYGYIYSSDYPPAILVGRFSGNSVADIATQVERSIYYERDIDENANWIGSAIGIADPYSYESGDNYETDQEHIVNLNNNLKSKGYSTAFTNNINTLKNSLNSGCGLVNYIGHGYTESWATTGFSVDDVTSLSNTNKLPVIVAAGCQNGHFRLSTCLAEGFLRGRDSSGKPIGAVGMMAFTTQIYWNPPMLGQDEFARVLTTDSIGFTKSFGEVVNAAYKRVIDVYKGSGFDVACQWALFGDPSLILRSKTPEKMSVLHNSTIAEGDNSFVVNCDTDNAIATLWYEGRIIDSKSVSEGTAHLALNDIQSGSELTLTVTGEEKVTYQKSIHVTHSSGIESIVSNSSYNIFPNPAKGEITINGDDGDIDIEVFDYSGKLIVKKEVKANSAFTLNKSGIFFVHILNDNSTHKVICL